MVAGFLAGAFSVLAAIALIGTSAANDMSGAAILGGIYGLLLGAYWSQIVLATEDKETLLGTAISEISGRVGPSVVNYQGKVFATLKPADNEQLVRGRLTVWFSAKPPGQSVPNAKASDAQAASAPIIIEGRSRKARTEFAVTVLGAGTITAFPRRQLAVAPTRRRVGKVRIYPGARRVRRSERCTKPVAARTRAYRCLAKQPYGPSARGVPLGQ